MSSHTIENSAVVETNSLGAPVFKDLRIGAVNVPVPKSGYTITIKILKNDKGMWVVSVLCQGKAVTVKAIDPADRTEMKTITVLSIGPLPKNLRM